MIKIFSWNKDVHKGKKVNVNKTFTFKLGDRQEEDPPAEEESNEDQK